MAAGSAKTLVHLNRKPFIDCNRHPRSVSLGKALPGEVRHQGGLVFREASPSA